VVAALAGFALGVALGIWPVTWLVHLTNVSGHEMLDALIRQHHDRRIALADSVSVVRPDRTTTDLSTVDLQPGGLNCKGAFDEIQQVVRSPDHHRSRIR
jgi:hypothetical protein